MPNDLQHVVMPNGNGSVTLVLTAAQFRALKRLADHGYHPAVGETAKTPAVRAVEGVMTILTQAAQALQIRDARRRF